MESKRFAQLAKRGANKAHEIDSVVISFREGPKTGEKCHPANKKASQHALAQQGDVETLWGSTH